MKLSIVTNVSNADLPRIKNVLPHWVKVFDKYFDELLIVYDDNSLSGRIHDLHKISYDESVIINALNELKDNDSRIKVLKLEKNQIVKISKIWFKKGAPFRCQDGSPIYPFIYAIHFSKNNFILKCDCDVLFYDNGFIEEAYKNLTKIDIITPPRKILPNHIVSSRAFIINKSNFYNKKLPISLKKLNLFQTITRIIRMKNIFDSKKFSRFYALEDALNNSIMSKNMTHLHLSNEYGNSMHITTNEEANDKFIEKVILDFERGIWPKKQEEYSMDYLKELWK